MRRCRYVRVASGLTQSEVSRDARMPRPILSNIENGRFTPPAGADYMVRLATALGIPVSDVNTLLDEVRIVDGKVVDGA